MPQFSVIIPAYRGSATIRRAVESALVQSYPPLDVVVCDDESPDDTAAALGPFLHKVVLIRQPHGGISSARNTAVRHSRGDWIVTLDQDDEWLPERLAATAAIIRSGPPNLDVVTTGALIRNPDGTERVHGGDVPATAEDQRLAILWHNFIYASAAVRRSAWERIGGFSEETDNEYDAWVRLLLGGSVIGTTGRPLAVYHVSHRQKSRDGLWVQSSRVTTLEWALSQDCLTRGERHTAQARLAKARSELLLAQALVAVADRSANARRLAFGASLRSPVSPLSRLKLMLAGIAPALASWYIQRAAGGAWYGPGGSGGRSTPAP